jgi:hemerythrin-like domain-containing protein
MPNPIEIIKSDHEKVKQLFEEYNALDENGIDRKSQLASEILKELTIHAKMEEKFFYPKLKENLSDEHPLPVDEAEAEHHAAKMIMLELKMMPVSSDTYDAKMTVLQENIEHHIEEEESELLPEAETVLGDEMDEIGKKMQEYKEDAGKNILDKLLGND